MNLIEYAERVKRPPEEVEKFLLSQNIRLFSRSYPLSNYILERLGSEYENADNARFGDRLEEVRRLQREGNREVEETRRTRREGNREAEETQLPRREESRVSEETQWPRREESRVPEEAQLPRREGNQDPKEARQIRHEENEKEENEKEENIPWPSDADSEDKQECSEFSYDGLEDANQSDNVVSEDMEERPEFSYDSLDNESHSEDDSTKSSFMLSLRTSLGKLRKSFPGRESEKNTREEEPHQPQKPKAVEEELLQPQRLEALEEENPRPRKPEVVEAGSKEVKLKEAELEKVKLKEAESEKVKLKEVEPEEVKLKEAEPEKEDDPYNDKEIFRNLFGKWQEELEECISDDYHILIDTCSILRKPRAFEMFYRSCRPLLERHGKRLIVPYVVVVELGKKICDESVEEPLKRRAEYALKRIKVDCKQTIEILGERSDAHEHNNFADSIFMEQILKWRNRGESVLLITQDYDLTTSVLKLRDIKCVRSEAEILVRKLDQSGALVEVEV